MQWINIHHTVLNSEEFLDSEPTSRGTWLCLMGYCAVQENGGRVVGAKEWKDRKCQQILRVTREELDADSMLWKWEGDDLLIVFYPAEKEEEVKLKREAGRRGGKSKSQAKTQASRNNGAKRNPSKTQAEPKQNPSKDPTERNRKGKEGNRKGTKDTSASPDAGGSNPEDFYLTTKKRKLTGKRLETFNAFWQAWAYAKGKAGAADAWIDIPKLTDSLVQHIIECAKIAAKDREKQRALRGNDYTPQYAQGWISGRRWEDYETSKPKDTPPVADQPPKSWRAALLLFFTREGMVGAAARMREDPNAYKSWGEVDPEYREDVIRIAKKMEGES